LRDQKSVFERITLFVQSELNGFVRPESSLVICQFISVLERDISQAIMYFDLELVYPYYIIFLSLLFDDLSRPPGSLFKTVISFHRHSLHLHLQSTLTENPLKNSYRSWPQLCFLLLNFNSSRISVRLCWVMTYCIIFCEVGQLFENLNVFWRKEPEEMCERVAYRPSAPIGDSNKFTAYKKLAGSVWHFWVWAIRRTLTVLMDARFRQSTDDCSWEKINIGWLSHRDKRN
jgi:hypothetical protein